MKNKFFLLFVILLGVFSASAYAQETYAEGDVTIDGINYRLDVRLGVENGEPTGRTVSAPGEAMVVSFDNNSVTELIIPEKIDVKVDGKTYTYKVTSIAADAFKNFHSLTSLTIPSTIVAIGGSALFNLKALKFLECDAVVPPAVVGKHFFKGANKQGLSVVLPAQSFELYLDHPVWKEIMYDPTIQDDGDVSEGEEGDDKEHIVIRTNYLLDDGLAAFEEKAKIHYELDSNGNTISWHYESYDSTYNEYNTVSYKRTFNNTNWQALYVPLEFVYDDWKEKFEVARIDGIVEQDTDRDGMYDHFYAKATILAEGDLILPHKLYLIRALNKSPEGGDVITVSKHSRLDSDDDELYRVYTTVIGDSVVADDVQRFVAAGSGNVYTFRGQYKAKNILEQRDANGNPVQPYCYAMTGGELKRPNPAITTGVPLGAFRWWLEVTPGSMLTEIVSKSVGFQFVSNENTTSVGSVEVNLNEIEGLGVYYNLGGVRVDEPRKGLFIKNGKKVLLR